MTTKLIKKAHKTLDLVRKDAADLGIDDEDDILSFACSKFTLNDFGHVARLAIRHGDRLRHVNELGWLAFDGKKWDQESGDKIARRLAQETLGDIIDEADWIESTGEKGCPKKARLSHAGRSCTSAKVKSLLEVAQSHLTASVDDFDANPFLIGVQNGVLDLRTGELEPHSPEYMLTRLAAVDYDPDAKSERWEKFIDEVMVGDTEIIEFLPKLFGYALFGHQKEEIITFCAGDENRQNDNGSNGKSVLLETIGRVFGDNRVTVSRKLLVEQGVGGGGIPNDLARLRGARIAIGAEFKRTDVVDEERWKKVTGADEMDARFLQKEFFSFKSTATAFYSVNTIPLLTSLDNGTKRRLLIIPFLNRWYRPEDCPEGEKVVDRDLQEKLAEELEGVLAWLVRGAIAYYNDGGLTIPQKLIALRNVTMARFNPLQDFQDTCLEPNDRMTLTYDEIARCYKNFLLANGASQREADSVKSQWLGRRLNDIGFVRDEDESKRRGVAVRRGFLFSERGRKYEQGEMTARVHNHLTVAAE